MSAGRAVNGCGSVSMARSPPPSAGLVNVLMEIDRDRFKKLFVDLMTKPVRKV